MITDKIRKEAAELGLEVIKSCNGGKSYEYRFLDCGHSQVMQHGNVLRSNKITCYTCAENKLVEFAEENNLRLLPKDIDCIKSHRKFQYKDCGHIFLCCKSAILRKIPKCKECLKEKHKKEAEKLGLEIIKDYVPGKAGYKVYKFLKCGHEMEASPSTVRANDFYCKKCFNEQLENEAIAANLTLLGDCPSGNKAKRLYRFNECGHERSIQTYQVRHKSVVCEECNEYYWNKPSSLYIIRISVGTMSWLKIGFSNNIDFRIKRYGLPECAVIDVLFIRDFSSGKLVNKYETDLHDKLKSFRLSDKIMREYHVKSGFTECFWCSKDTAIKLAIEVCNTAP